jgi:glutamyl-Q tRNA(Asp) synthetase
MTGSTPVFRFAPSPNGELHLGHALSALTSYEMAQRLGGRFLLRIEDIDVGRSRPEYIDAIFEDLAWLGIKWEESVLRQSEHFDAYRAAARRLEQLDLLYPSLATRAELANAAASSAGAVDPDGAPLVARSGQAPSTEEVPRRQAAGKTFALRLDMRRAVAEAQRRLDGRALSFTSFEATGVERLVDAQPERWGDAVIIRKDTPTSYHLSVVVDDARQGVTHVVRGADLLAATDLHRLLQVLLDFPAPVYHHHPLLTDESGRKLSKSARDTSLRSLRQAGMTASDIRAKLGR